LPQPYPCSETGRDDFGGGLVEVVEFRSGTSAGNGTPFVRVAQERDTRYNREILAAKQEKLRQEFGKEWTQADPDNRPEFNEW
jgi:hypothetical protein